MAYKNVFTAEYRRKREGKTDYKKRLVFLKSGVPRLVVRKTAKNMIAQIIEYSENGDRVVVSVHTRELAKYGWPGNTSNIASAYLVGLLIGVKAKGKEAILDIGLQPPIKGTRIFAVLKGAIDGGLQIPYSEEVLPTEERISGAHIAGYASMLKDDEELYKKKFSSYLKKKTDPADIKTQFDKAKEKILSGKE